jgi:hypothetical protein
MNPIFLEKSNYQLVPFGLIIIIGRVTAGLYINILTHIKYI